MKTLCSIERDKLSISHSNNPRKIYIETSYYCNSHCKHCYNSSNNSHLENLFDLDKYYKAIFESSINVSQIIISGGEPFALKNIYEVIDIFTLNYPVKILTNGSCCNEELLQLIIFRAASLQVTLEGHNQEVDNYIRTDIFDKTVETIKRFITLGGKDLLTVSVSLGLPNYIYIEDIIKFCKDLGVRNLQFSFILPQGRAIENWSHFCLNSYQKLQVVKELAHYKQLYSLDVNITFSGLKQYIYNIASNERPECKYLSEEILLKPNGGISICPKLSIYCECQKIDIDYRFLTEQYQIETITTEQKCKKCDKLGECMVSCIV